MKKKETDNSPKKNKAQEKSTKNQEVFGDALTQMLLAETEKKPKKRPYFYLEDFGMLIPYWGILSVEKKEDYVTSAGKIVLRFAIVINQGIESSPNMPFGERWAYYMNEQRRDSKFDAIMAAMEKHNYEFTRI